MIFSPQISFDTILALFSVLGSLIYIYAKLKSTVAVIQLNIDNFIKRIDRLDDEVAILAKTTEVMAVQTERDRKSVV